MVVSSQLRGVKVELRGDGLATDLRSFTLAHPPRLAIDFPGVLNSFPKKFLEVDHPLLKDIRLGQHSDKLRIVLTFPATELPPYRIAREAGGLTIIVGKIEKGIEEGMKSEAAEKQEMDGTRMPEGKIPAEPPPPQAAVPPAKPADEKKSTSPPENRGRKAAVKIYPGERITSTLSMPISAYSPSFPKRPSGRLSRAPRFRNHHPALDRVPWIRPGRPLNLQPQKGRRRKDHPDPPPGKIIMKKGPAVAATGIVTPFFHNSKRIPVRRI
jgi:hypothetical protein